MPLIGFRSSPGKPMLKLIAALLVHLCLMASAMAAEMAPLAPPGDAARGRAIVVDRQKGFCLLCHSGPFPEQRFMGNLAPDLAGAGQRYTTGELRLRIAHPQKVLPNTIMPAYFETEGLTRVAKAFQGKPILDAQQIEDVVAFLATLKESTP